MTTAEFGYAEIQSIFSLKPTSTKDRVAPKMRLPVEVLSALSCIVSAVAQFCFTGQQQKLLLFVDDLQWADAEFFSWLKYFLMNPNNTEVVILATARSEEIDFTNNLSDLLENLKLAEQISLTELSYLKTSDAFELMKKHIPEGKRYSIRQSELKKLYGNLQGNPLFLIESIKHLVSQHDLNTVGSTGNEGAPKIYAMLKRRIDLLHEGARQILLFAAVIQRQFSVLLIQEITDYSDTTLFETLDDLWKKRMIREVKNGEYDFSHDSLRETCYASLSAPQKSIMHIRVAKTLEKLYESQSEKNAAEVAVHYEKSGDLLSALLWFENALAHSRETLASKNSIEYAERCLRLIDKTIPVSDIAERKVNILASLATGYALSEGFGSENLLIISKELQKLLPFVKDPETRWQAVNRLRLTATFSCQTYRALRLTELQLSVAKETASVTRVVEAYRSRAFVLYQLGRMSESLRYLDEGYKIGRSAENDGILDRFRPSWSLAMLVRIRILVLFLIGRFNDSAIEVQNNNDHQSVTGDPHVRSFVNLWVGEYHCVRNRPDDVLLTGQEILQVGIEEQLISLQCIGQFFCHWAKWKKGYLDVAIDGLSRTIKTYQSMDDNILLPWWYQTLSEMQHSAGLIDEALATNGKAVHWARSTRTFNRNPENYRIRANLFASKQYDVKAVIRLFDLCIDTSVKQSSMFCAINGLTDKLVFLRSRCLSDTAVAKQLRDIVGSVQASHDFERLAIAKSLLADSA